MNPVLLPLALLEADNGESIEGITRFQKLVFLFDKECHGEDSLYPFRPDNYGPFSRRLYDDIDWLVDEGLIEAEDKTTQFGNETSEYSLTDKGKKALEYAEKEGKLEVDTEVLDQLKSEYNDRNLWDLLETVYGRYPSYAENSKLNI